MQAGQITIDNLTVNPEALDGPIKARAKGNEFFYENTNYDIRLTDTGTVDITSKTTGENYRIWGDPHVAIDGKHAFDFYGDTTFLLEDGTKVTIQTKPQHDDARVTYASTVTITDGTTGQTTQVTGVDPFTRGDLAVSHHISDAAAVEARADDGNVIRENPFGAGFLGVDGNGKLGVVVDQEYINLTDHRLNGTEVAGQQFQALFTALQSFANLLSMFQGLMSVSFSGSVDSGADEPAVNFNLPTSFEFTLKGPNAF
ncbi:DUF1521 domain-containing protein [Lysobacter sp. GX 14042]|uniref:DUF1521 domain-containing protein n=1 Tax=Lysobacter sp. GX 14042 TaxID=2907155 RepID=UPI001F46DCAC|nr:DUF1521 domain-containing protein [Lysobacter sp. GX 14042]MCE7031895.1 DUF1521 domain-containing protein [Lysobacter sp. GX 14042]